jgi:hypothetical protein
VSVNLKAGDTVTCSFTNNLLPTLKIVKNAVGGNGTFGYTLSPLGSLPAPYNITTSGGTGQFPTVASGQVNFLQGLTPYSITESSLPQGWAKTGLVCQVGGAQIGSASATNSNGVPTTWGFTPNFGDNVVCTFTNRAPSGELAPTQTTCGAFAGGTNTQQSGINYSDDGTGKISQNLNPGVFFYFTRLTPTSNTTTASITQSNDNPSGIYNFGVQSVQLFTAACGSLNSTFGVTSTNNVQTVTITVPNNAKLQAGTQYIVAVKYSSKSIAGQPVPTSTGTCTNVKGDVCYSYQTFVNSQKVDSNQNPFVLTKNPVFEF